MNTTDNLSSQLTGIFRDTFDDDSIVLRDDMTAADVENWDSLSHINLLHAVEKAFRVRFTTAEATNLKNVGELGALIRKKLS